MFILLCVHCHACALCRLLGAACRTGQPSSSSSAALSSCSSRRRRGAPACAVLADSCTDDHWRDLRLPHSLIGLSIAPGLLIDCDVVGGQEVRHQQLLLQRTATAAAVGLTGGGSQSLHS